MAVRADGSQGRTLSVVAGGAFPAAADPRGELALVVRSSDEGQVHREGLWTVPLAGGSASLLAPAADRIRNPAWSPDGAWVVFESSASSYRDLYRVGRDGSDLRRLTNAEHGSFQPAVAADGRVAMSTSRDGNAEIYVQGTSGAAQRLTEHPGDDLRPAWAGEQLLWLTHREGAARVWRMAGDGSGKTALRPVQGRVLHRDYAVSPDGSEVALVVQTSPTEVHIEVVSVSTGAVSWTVDGPGVDDNPTWSPDGQQLAYTSEQSGSPEVHVVSEGVEPRRVAAGWLPRWVR